jgi:hypothetical protein
MGLLPKASTQITVGAWQSAIAYDVARMQGEMGVDPEAAAVHAFNLSSGRMCFNVFIAPVAAFMLLFVWDWNPVVIFFKVSLVTMAFVIWKRMNLWERVPWPMRVQYRIPTWFIATMGGLLIFLSVSVMFMRFSAAPNPAPPPPPQTVGEFGTGS